MSMLHQRHDIDQLTIEQTSWLVSGSLVIVVRPEAAGPDWELVATTLDTDRLDPGSYRISVRTTNGLVFGGDAVLVRQVDKTLVFRGAGPLDPE